MIPRQLFDTVETLVNAARIEEAWETIRPYYEQYPNDFDILHNVGVIFTYQKKLNNALTCFEASYAMDQFNENHLYNYASCLFACGQHESSLNILRRTIALNPNKSTAVMTAGEVCFFLKRYKEASEYYLKYLQLLPHKKKEMLPQVIYCLQWAEANEPDNIDVKLNLYESLTEAANEQCATSAS